MPSARAALWPPGHETTHACWFKRPDGGALLQRPRAPPGQTASFPRHRVRRVRPEQPHPTNLPLPDRTKILPNSRFSGRGQEDVASPHDGPGWDLSTLRRRPHCPREAHPAGGCVGGFQVPSCTSSTQRLGGLAVCLTHMFGEVCQTHLNHHLFVLLFLSMRSPLGLASLRVEAWSGWLQWWGSAKGG